MKQAFLIKLILLSICALIFFQFSTNAQSFTGNGSDGNLTIPTGETFFVDNIKAAVDGDNPAGSSFINVVDVSGFAVGQEILIISMQDAFFNYDNNVVGIYEFRTISSINGNTLTLTQPLENSYNANYLTKHQVIRVPNYLNVTVYGTLTCDSWNGTTGGILAFRANGYVGIAPTGIIDASAKGYRGGTQYGSSHGGGQGGESYFGLGGKGGNYSDNGGMTRGSGGGGGCYQTNGTGNSGLAGGGGGSSSGTVALGSPRGGAGGGGSGHAGSGGGAGYGTFGYGGNGYNNVAGQNGGENVSGNGGFGNVTGTGGGGGGTYGTAELTKLLLGSGGGRAGVHSGYVPGIGGNGGGILLIYCANLVNTGSIKNNGENGGNGGTYSGGGGAGAGGSLHINTINLTNAGSITANGGTGGNAHYGGTGGAGGDGRMRIDYGYFTNETTINPNPYSTTNNFGATVSAIYNTNNTTEPYELEALAISETHTAITSAQVFYSVNGAAFTSTNLTLDEVEDYIYIFSGAIPAQNINSVVNWYVKASDGTNDYYAPTIAPANYFTFNVAPNPPQNLTATAASDAVIELSWEAPSDPTNFVNYKLYRSLNADFIPSEDDLITTTTELVYSDNNTEDFTHYYYKVSANYNFGGTLSSSFSNQADAIANNQSVFTAYGFVKLEDQATHNGIKILFIPVSGMAEWDSTYTDDTGYFEIQINPGVYSLQFIYDGYQTYNKFTEYTLVNDLDLGDNTLIKFGTLVTGNVSGVWSGYYTVTGNITLPENTSLTIEPGTKIRFNGQYWLKVYGLLEVQGTEEEPVVFTSMPANQVYARGQWEGIWFYDAASDQSFIDNALIEYSRQAIWASYCSPTFTDMIVMNNSDYAFHLRDDNTSFVENIVMQNNTNYGILMHNKAMPTINNCVIDNSGRGIEASERSSFNIYNSVIKNNTNHGIYLDNCYVKILNNTIQNNAPAGLYIHNWSETRIENCTINNNSSIGIDFYHNNKRNCWVKNSVINNNGNGIRMQYQNSVLVENCRIENNNDYGIRLSDYTTNGNNTLVAKNNIIINNRIGFYTDQRYNNVTLFRNDLSFNQSFGIYNWDSYNTFKIEYNTIFGNLYDGIYLRLGQTENINGNIISNNLRFGIQLAENCSIETFNNNIVYNNATNVNNYALLPQYSYQYVTVDEYGDSVDVYKNKSIDPAFNLQNTVDLTLSPESHCINNGNEFLRDPDESIIDLGAYYYDLGCPHNLWVTGTNDSSVGLEWEPTVLNGASGYNVYYKMQEDIDYTFYQFTNLTNIDVTGLTNNENYDFAIKTVFPNYTSIFSKKVTAVPGIPTMTIEPATLYAYLPDGVTSTDKTIEVLNNGTKDLNVSFNYFESGSAYFNGGSYINYGDYTAWDFLTAFTMEAWVKRQNNGHFEFMGKAYDRFAFYVSSSNNRIGIYKAYGNRYTYTNRQEFTSDYSLPANEWHHLAATWTGNSVKFYVDGELVQEFINADSRMVPGSGRNFQLGRRADENNYYLQGFMSEARVWNYVRTKEQIKANMFNRISGQEEGLIFYAPLENDFLNKAQDISTWADLSGSPEITSFEKVRHPLFTATPAVASVAPGESLEIQLNFQKLYNNNIITNAQVFTNINTEPRVQYPISILYKNEPTAISQHFVPVEETGIPFKIIITGATVDEQPLVIGDEIAAFDGDLCVGSGIYEGSYNLIFTAWQENPALELPGYTLGNQITIKIYRVQNDREASCLLLYQVGNGTFGNGEFAAMALIGTVYTDIIIDIPANAYKLISFNHIPKYTNAPQLYSSLEALRIVKDEDGKVYVPQFSINTLGNVNIRKAYYVYSDVADELVYNGIAINPEDWTITLKPRRWNWIAYLLENEVATELAVPEELIENIKVVKTSDGRMWVPEFNINTIINFEPGLGYMLAMNNDVLNNVQFTYQNAQGKSGVRSSISVTNQFLETKHYEYVRTGMPYNILIEPKITGNYKLSSGDEIAVFDGEKCVGAVVYNGEESILLNAWEGNHELGLNGFAAGNQMDIRIYSKNNNMEYSTDILARTTSNATVFGGDYYSNIALALKNSYISNNETIQLDASPNPFENNTNIKFNNDNTILSIYNDMGELVIEKDFSNEKSGAYSFEWNGLDRNGNKLSAGAYLCKIQSNEVVNTIKIILIK